MITPNQLLLEALEKRWKTFLAELKRCRAEFSNEAVHDLRVALRRLLSLIQLLNSVEPRPRLRKLSRALKIQLDEFDDLRDTQVMLAEISETIHDLPGLEPLQRHLERREKRLLKDLRKKLSKLDLKETARRIRKTHDALTAETKTEWDAPLLQSVDDAFQIVRQRLTLVDSSQPATIHRVRVAFKKFRYMVEIIHPLLEGFPEANLKRMNEYQTLMGEIQDMDVLLQTLTEVEPASLPNPQPVRRHYESRHTDAISAYLQVKDILAAFWRASPEEPFPWEKTP
ncbi:MAG: CHAD domain-containing protein [Chloroflexi bacterium]|nr:CHAD domain-containing protein [Chloroflexota bacterium]